MNKIYVNAKYLGDGVYAQYDGYHIVLTTGCHATAQPPYEVENIIALEDGVISLLKLYVKDLHDNRERYNQELRNFAKEKENDN